MVLTENNIQAIKEALKKRKQFAIYLDTAILIEELNNKLESILGINLSYTDTLYSILVTFKRRLSENYELSTLQYEVYADAIAHKVLRLHINKINDDNDFVKLVQRIGKNKELFVMIINFINSLDLLGIEFNKEELIRMLNEFEKIAFKDFEIAVVNIYRNELTRLGYKRTDRIKSLKTLKRYIEKIDEYNRVESSGKKYVDLTEILQEIESLFNNDSDLIEDFDFSDIKNKINDGTKQ